jgi:hypothetical protein
LQGRNHDFFTGKHKNEITRTDLLLIGPEGSEGMLGDLGNTSVLLVLPMVTPLIGGIAAKGGKSSLGTSFLLEDNNPRPSSIHPPFHSIYIKTVAEILTSNWYTITFPFCNQDNDSGSDLITKKKICLFTRKGN